MLKLSILELIFRGIPEGLLIFWGIYVLSKMELNYKKIIIAALISTTEAYFMRSLPVNVYLVIITSLGTLILLNIFLCKISIIDSIKNSIYISILEMLSEAIGMSIFKVVLGIDSEVIMSTQNTKTMFMATTLILFAIIIFVCKYLISKFSKGKDKDIIDKNIFTIK